MIVSLAEIVWISSTNIIKAIKMQGYLYFYNIEWTIKYICIKAKFICIGYLDKKCVYISYLDKK